MTVSNSNNINQAILEAVRTKRGYPAKDVLEEAGKQLNALNNQHLQEAILAHWQSMFTNGILAWGVSLLDYEPLGSRFHMSVTGRPLLHGHGIALSFN